MQKTYEESLRLVTRDCDMFGRWRPSAALEAMQEAAGTHAALLGVGREELIRAHNVVWVLSRAALTLARCPAIGERVTVETFPHPCLRFFYPRYFVFYDEARRRIGAAGTLWALVDLSTRRPASVPAVAERLPDNRDIPAPLELPRAVPKLAGQERLFTREPAFTELDVNGHVNNARYADYLLDALGLPLLRERTLTSVQVHFSSEILPGERLDMRLVTAADGCYLCGSSGGRVRFEAGGTLAPREP